MFQKKKIPREIINPSLSQDMQKIRERVANLEVPQNPRFSQEPAKYSAAQPMNNTPQKTPKSFEQVSKTFLEIPEPPKPKEIVVPNIERGPLFINKDKFFEAENLVHNMEELSNELGNKLNLMKETLKEDLATSDQLESLISAVENKVNSLKEIVSP